MSSTDTVADGAVFNIQRFSIHDGPGVRTTVFLKGCTLRCFWCHNPESVQIAPVLQFYPERCVDCGKCFAACPRGCHQTIDGQHVILRDRCDACGLCVDSCYSQALTLAGKIMAVAQVIAEVERDAAFYQASGGGVTLSGGEPARQPEFSRAILKGCHDLRIHTVVETAANVPWRDLKCVLDETDLILLDLKHADSTRHLESCGAGNELIMANIRLMDRLDIPIIARTPVVPSVNATPSEIAELAAIAGSLRNLREFVLLPFHRLADSKYVGLGIEHKAANLDAPSAELMECLADAARPFVSRVRIG